MKHVFVVGCPRSGTSWFQLLLAQHAQVATTRETHLFNGYLQHLDRARAQYRVQPAAVGMTQLLTDSEFYALCAKFATAVLEKIAEANAAATVVMEKTPTHLRVAPFIVKVLPEAYFIHVIRDPRAVVSSLCAIGRSGRSWASTGATDNARMWRTDVTKGRAIRELTPKYIEVRYEDLAGDQGGAILEQIAEWLELPVPAEFGSRAIEACRIEHLQQGGEGVRSFEAIRPTAEGFFRKGRSDSWREDLSARDIQVIEYITRDLMQELGYPFVSTAKGGLRKPLRLVTSELIDSLEAAIRKGTERSFNRLRSVL